MASSFTGSEGITVVMVIVAVFFLNYRLTSEHANMRGFWTVVLISHHVFCSEVKRWGGVEMTIGSSNGLEFKNKLINRNGEKERDKCILGVILIYNVEHL